MADDEALNRAAEVNEQFRPVRLSAGTVTRPAGPQSRTVHSFLRATSATRAWTAFPNRCR